MSDLDLDKKDQKRDTLDGGFAVVDRERLIEEETREVTPWYKHFIHVFTSPEKMMEECFNADPPKGASVGIVGIILFTIIYMLLCFVNSEYKQVVYDQLRMQGLSETAIDSAYSLSMVTGSIGAVIGVFVSCLFGAILLQIIKVILRDKAKFSAIYKVLLLATMVTYAVQCVDGLVCLAIGQFTTIFSLAPILGVDMGTTSALSVLANTISLENLVNVLIIVIGYKVITHTSYKKAVVAVVIYEVISIGVSLGIAAFTASLMQNLM